MVYIIIDNIFNKIKGEMTLKRKILTALLSASILFGTVPNICTATENEDKYDYDIGTSMAAPCVAATAALILSCVDEFDGATLRDILLASADSSSSVKVANGLILNAAKAILMVQIGLFKADSDNTTDNSTEDTKVKTEKLSKDKIDLDGYAYDTDTHMRIQVEDNEKVLESIAALEKNIGIEGIKITDYSELAGGIFTIELPVLVSRELTEQILNDENITYATPTLQLIWYD